MVMGVPALAVWVILLSHSALLVESPGSGNWCPSAHVSTAEYAVPTRTCVCTWVRRLREKNAGPMTVGQVVAEVQMRSNGTSGHEEAVLAVSSFAAHVSFAV